MKKGPTHWTTRETFNKNCWKPCVKMSTLFACSGLPAAALKAEHTWRTQKKTVDEQLTSGLQNEPAFAHSEILDRSICQSLASFSCKG